MPTAAAKELADKIEAAVGTGPTFEDIGAAFALLLFRYGFLSAIQEFEIEPQEERIDEQNPHVN